MLQTAEIARDMGDAEAAAAAIEAAAAAERADALARRRASQRSARSDGAAVEVDARMDRAVKGLHQGLIAAREYLEGEPGETTVADLLARYFPHGLGAVTRARFEEELFLVERMHTAANGPDRPALDGLGLGPWVDRIGAHLGPYRDALRVEARVSAGDVQAAADEMYIACAAVVGYVTWRHRAAPGDLHTLLAPLDEQLERWGAILRARKGGQQVADRQPLAEGAGDGLGADEAGDGLGADGAGDGLGAAGDAPLEAPLGEVVDDALDIDPIAAPVDAAAPDEAPGRPG